MTAVILATAAMLQTALPASPLRAHPAADSVRAGVAATVPRTPRITSDKLQHFFMSYAISSFSYAAARAAGVDRESSLYGATAGTIAVGAAKEIVDAKTAGDPSIADLFADILGAAAAYVILRQVH